MLTKDEAFRLTRYSDSDLAPMARDVRDRRYGGRITFSPKVFLPLTHLCRDTCSYCTFVKNPSQVDEPYLGLEDILETCKQGKLKNCSEALFTLGELPELKYEVARNWLAERGYETTIDYLVQASRTVLTKGAMLPHVNPGAISDRDITKLKQVSVSQGMMLESIAGRLCEPGGPHFGSPDKTPAKRLATLEAAGRCRVPFTTGILVGIGETRLERIEALLAIRELQNIYGHIQEVIIQNFIPKQKTGMASAPECDEHEHLWTISAARLIFEDTIHIQAPPNLSNSVTKLVDAGIDDLGGISPVTIDYVNPEKPWPNLETLSKELNAINKDLKARAAIYPEFISKFGFVSDKVMQFLEKQVDEQGYLNVSPEQIDLSALDQKPKNDRFINSNLPVSIKTRLK